ncbi:MAG: efflux RND transporter periplasmic adaptor subunit [Ruminococcus sp.]|nr:efflux RND transporter periplasmic adaptor subunit [Ruminococcus sp.]
MKRIIAGAVALLIAGGSYYGYKTYTGSEIKSSAASIVKEVSVSKGNVTAGVTESAAVSIESLEQTYDLSLTSTGISASVESGKSSSGSGSGGGNAAAGMGGGMPGMGGMGMSMGGMSSGKSGGSSGGMGSTSVSTQSESSAVQLVIDEVKITEGQSVKKGDVIMTITQESIDEARSELTKAVEDAKLALTQAQIDEQETKLSAQFEYDTRITEGKNAKTVYDTAMNEIARNINELYTQIYEVQTEISECDEEDEKQLTQLNTQLESLQLQLTSALNSRAAEELSAKQTYDEAVMYYDNAQDLYDVSVNDVGTASEEAQDAVDSAQADLEAFEEYIADGTIRAEYTGVITSVGYSSGDTLSADTAIASYADAESITVTVNVTEDDISAVHIDDTVEVDFLSYPDDIFEGYVSSIGSSSTSGSSNTVSYPVTVVITTTPETLLSGMTANVTFITKQVKDVLYVSNKAVKTEGKESYVLRKADDGSEEKISVEVGFSNGIIAEIKGVSEGDTLLIKGKES